LRAPLRQWIIGETSEAVAERFFPLVAKTLSDMGYDLAAPTSESKVQEVKGRLRDANVTPRLMQRALAESRRAAEAGQSTLAWLRATYSRAYGEDMAEQVLAKTRILLEGAPEAPFDPPSSETPSSGTPSSETSSSETSSSEASLSETPPSPEQVFAFLLAWEELGGTSRVAAFRELLRLGQGHLPSN
jgi:hypothetical protein